MRPFRIAHVSDLHLGSPLFIPAMMDRAIAEVNAVEPDVLIVSGDLTTAGLRQEYVDAQRYLARFDCPRRIIIPGNHDARNVGYVHFEELFGERQSVLRHDGVAFVAVDSSEPDLDHGVVGRGRYRWIKEQFAVDARLKVFVLHHHLIPIPGTGRERNVVHDAGDTLEMLIESGCQLVLSGHKHVPHAWRLENLFVVNTGTVSTLRVRGKGRPCYNLVEFDGDTVTVDRKYPFHEQERIVEFTLSTLVHHRAAGAVP